MSILFVILTLVAILLTFNLNTVGFIDDTRAFASIPVRHDVARRFDAAYLANEVSRHRLSKSDALEVGADIAYNLSKEYFKL